MNQKLSGFVYGVDASSMFSQAMSLLSTFQPTLKMVGQVSEMPF